MHGQLGLRSPHGPCTMCSPTSLCSCGSVLLSGTWQDTTASTCSAVLGLSAECSIIRSRWMCGKPRFWMKQKDGYMKGCERALLNKREEKITKSSVPYVLPGTLLSRHIQLSVQISCLRTGLLAGYPFSVWTLVLLYPVGRLLPAIYVHTRL